MPAISKLHREVGNRIRELRLSRGMTLERLGERADLDPSYLGRIERGAQNVAITNLSRIAKGLGVPARELFP